MSLNETMICVSWLKRFFISLIPLFVSFYLYVFENLPFLTNDELWW